MDVPLGSNSTKKLYQNKQRGLQNMKKTKTIATKSLALGAGIMMASIAGMIPQTAEAQIAGKNLILIHGYRSTDLSQHPDDAEQARLADQYWADYWLPKAEAVIHWSSADRIAGGIKDTVARQLKTVQNQGLCLSGCVIVTHSTGDLVTRYVLSRMSALGLDKNRLKILAVLDFAGAGGGTELVDTAIAISEGSGWVNSAMKTAVNAFMGFTPTKGQMGVMYDLQPANARNTATAPNVYPRLRFVGTGWEYGGVTKPFIKGSDDSVVPLHSACGATLAGAYDSCAKGVKPNGQLSSVSAPSSLWYNHYVVLMGEKTGHGGVINNKRTGDFTTVSNNFSAGGLNVDFATTTGYKWWSPWTKVRLVKDGSKYSMSENVYRTLNN
jgi:hypothetical protein